MTYPYSWTKQLEDVFRAKAKERMLSGNPVLKSEQGRNQYSSLQISAETKPIDTRKTTSQKSDESLNTIQMNVHKFLLYIQEFKSLYTKEEYNQLMREYHKDYEDYLISLIDYDNEDKD